MKEEYHWSVREKTLGVSREGVSGQFNEWVAAARLERAAPAGRANLVDFLNLHLDVGAAARSVQRLLGWSGASTFAATFSAPPGLPLAPGEPTQRTFVPRFVAVTERHQTRSLIDGSALAQLNRLWAQRAFLIELLPSGGVVRTAMEPVAMDELPQSLEVIVSDRRIYSLHGEQFSVPDDGEAYRRKNRDAAPLEHSRKLLGLHERSAAALEEVLFSKLRADEETRTLHARSKERLVVGRQLRELLRKRVESALEILLDSRDPEANAQLLDWLKSSEVDDVPPPVENLELGSIKRSCRRPTWRLLIWQYQHLSRDVMEIVRERMLHTA